MIGISGEIQNKMRRESVFHLIIGKLRLGVSDTALQNGISENSV
jgi:hypothetical protein